MLEEFSATISSNIFSSPFSLSSPSGTPIRQMLVHLLLSQRFFRLTSFFFSGEGNGTPLLYCCLENPMDGGNWWAAVYRVMTERLHFHFSLSSTGEGNGIPLQCSWLENPRDGEAWWAAIYGVAQTSTQLKQLSSSIFFHSFFYILFCSSDFHHSILQVIYPFFRLGYSFLLIPPCILFFCVCLFFSSSR